MTSKRCRINDDIVTVPMSPKVTVMHPYARLKVHEMAVVHAKSKLDAMKELFLQSNDDHVELLHRVYKGLEMRLTDFQCKMRDYKILMELGQDNFVRSIFGRLEYRPDKEDDHESQITIIPLISGTIDYAGVVTNFRINPDLDRLKRNMD